MANHFNSVQIIVLANQKLKNCTVAFMHMDQECMDTYMYHAAICDEYRDAYMPCALSKNFHYTHHLYANATYTCKQKCC